MLSRHAHVQDRTVADFFAGIGLVRYGLEKAGWRGCFAVDHDVNKEAMYAAHFPDAEAHYHCVDIREVRAESVPTVTLAHASFPCTDVSLAGAREGLGGPQSSAFWAFARILREMGERRPPLVMLENVTGLLTSNGGRDLVAILEALGDLGYYVDVLVLDAAHFAPQSRVRLIVIAKSREGFDGGVYRSQRALDQIGQHPARPEKLGAFIRKHAALPWSLSLLPPLPPVQKRLAEIVDVADSEWWEPKRTAYLLSQMYPRHLAWVTEARERDGWQYGTVFRRMRQRDGRKQSTAELRTDGLAGCLRTPKGGSARQILLRAGYGQVDARLLNGRECARLMGADEYTLDPAMSLNTVLFGFGDAVCSPVFTWLAEHVLDPILDEVEAPAVFEPAR